MWRNQTLKEWCCFLNRWSFCCNNKKMKINIFSEMFVIYYYLRAPTTIMTITINIGYDLLTQQISYLRFIVHSILLTSTKARKNIYVDHNGEWFGILNDFMLDWRVDSSPTHRFETFLIILLDLWKNVLVKDGLMSVFLYHLTSFFDVLKSVKIWIL